MAKKKILFVSYGGVHVHMLAPVILECRKVDELETHVIGLTAAPGIYRNKYGIECESAKDYITGSDNRAHQFGTEILEQMKANGEKIIDEEETIAYLGTGFDDLVQQQSSLSKAWGIFNDAGRAELLPLTFMNLVFDKVQPDLVITTNSPRGEKAANLVAKERGIKSILIPDLFCYLERYKFVSDIICVLSPESKKNLIERYGIKSDRIKITGNPSFDDCIEKAGPVDHQWREKNLGIAAKEKVFLWADQANHFEVHLFKFVTRSDEEIIETLERLLVASESANVRMIVRPHPSQSLKLYIEWCNSHDITLANDCDINELIKSVDIVGSMVSNVLIQAHYIGRIALQLSIRDSKKELDIENWDNVFVAEGLDNIERALRLAAAAEIGDVRLNRIERATPKIVKVILDSLDLITD